MRHPVSLLCAILLLSLSVGTGCSAICKLACQQPEIQRPQRPILESLMETPDGGICMDKGDTAELLLYLDGLEK